MFINLNFKGYNKTNDVRFALSANELLIEVKYPSQSGKLAVHRLSKTLEREVNVADSSIELLVDFISVRLKKLEKSSQWDSLGYDISEFTIPKFGQLKSNFLSLPKPEPVVVPSQVQNHVSDNDNKENLPANTNQAEHPTDNSEEKQKDEVQIQKDKGVQLSFLSLESSIIFKIY